MPKMTVPKIIAKKATGEKIVMLTCYDASFAKILDQTPLDMILVGDSLGMVIQGNDTTLPVTLEDILYHTRAVVNGAKNSFVVADLPFMTYQASKKQALLSAGRCLKEGKAHAVKLEGGLERAKTVKAMVQAGIPVMGHIGLKPQSIHQMGGYKIQGKTFDQSKQLLQDALALEEAGCFCLVLEGIEKEVAGQITKQITIPTIGIASGPNCDGQVLVLYDLLGMDITWQPKFAKKYMNGFEMISQAVNTFIKEVHENHFQSKGDAIGLAILKRSS